MLIRDFFQLIICKSATDYDAAATYFNDQNNMRLNIVSLSQEILEADYSHPWSDEEVSLNVFRSLLLLVLIGDISFTRMDSMHGHPTSLTDLKRSSNSCAVAMASIVW